MIQWTYSSPIGKWIIRPNSSGRFELIMDNTCYGTYHSAVAAADDVYMHVTGCSAWDFLDGKVSAPTDIYEWTKTEL